MGTMSKNPPGLGKKGVLYTQPVPLRAALGEPRPDRRSHDPSGCRQLFVATMLTLLVLPVFYITLYRGKAPVAAPA